MCLTSNLTKSEGMCTRSLYRQDRQEDAELGITGDSVNRIFQGSIGRRKEGNNDQYF